MNETAYIGPYLKKNHIRWQIRSKENALQLKLQVSQQLQLMFNSHQTPVDLQKLKVSFGSRKGDNGEF